MNNRTTIEGELGTYTVGWEPYGWSWGQVFIYEKKKILFFIPFHKKIWKGSYDTINSMEQAHPEKLRRMYSQTVRSYEDYLKEWSDML